MHRECNTLTPGSSHEEAMIAVPCICLARSCFKKRRAVAHRRWIDSAIDTLFYSKQHTPWPARSRASSFPQGETGANSTRCTHNAHRRTIAKGGVKGRASALPADLLLLPSQVGMMMRNAVPAGPHGEGRSGGFLSSSLARRFAWLWLFGRGQSNATLCDLSNVGLAQRCGNSLAEHAAEPVKIRSR